MLYELIGNFGLAILVLTLIVKLLFFPLANKSYVSMSKMKKLQPEMEKMQGALRRRPGKDAAGDDGAVQAREGQPAAGCLPILMQIPVFFALYKVLFVTIEMRHAPFFGWIQDLSAPDPTTIFNLFGLLPFDHVPESGTCCIIGVWPLIMGVTMWLQQKLNPPPADPVQARIFKFMPIIFTFMLAPFPAGLVIYWAWNNTLSIVQQYTIMRRHGTPIGARRKPAVVPQCRRPPSGAAAAGGGGDDKKGGKGSAKFADGRPQPEDAAEEIEAARKLFARPCDFVAGRPRPRRCRRSRCRKSPLPAAPMSASRAWSMR